MQSSGTPPPSKEQASSNAIAAQFATQVAAVAVSKEPHKIKIEPDVCSLPDKQTNVDPILPDFVDSSFIPETDGVHQSPPTESDSELPDLVDVAPASTLVVISEENVPATDELKPATDEPKPATDELKPASSDNISVSQQPPQMSLAHQTNVINQEQDSVVSNGDIASTEKPVGDDISSDGE